MLVKGGGAAGTGSGGLTDDQRAEVEEAFAIFDSEGRKFLDIYEVKILIRSLGFRVKRSDVLRMVHEVGPDADADADTQNEGRVELPQLLDMMSSLYATVDPREEMENAFRLFDDGSGLITLQNLKRVAKELGKNMSDEELQAMIEEFDKDADGAINLEEFTHIMQSY
jgi:centrin-3